MTFQSYKKGCFPHLFRVIKPICGTSVAATFIIKFKTGSMIKTWQPRYIDPFTDYGFKMLFGQKRNKQLLIAFLNALLQGKKVIKDLIYLDKEQLGLSSESRKSIFDVYCEDENGDRFVIEIQRQLLLHFTSRAVYYATFPVIEQGVKGDWNHQLKEIYHVWILDHIFPDSDPAKMIHEVKLTDTETGKIFDNSLTYLLIETPKFIKEETVLETPLDKWLFVLTNLSQLQEIPVTLQDDPIFKEFFMMAELLKMTPEERGIYLASLKEKWDEYSLKETASILGQQLGQQIGEQIGQQIGEQIGQQRGEQIGQQKEQIKIAAEMKKNNEPTEKIAKYTGLSMEQIDKLST
jgi:predicted transposase/invertase (TIGR01784 family)